MTKGVPSTPIITETEQEANHVFETIAEAFLSVDDFERISGEQFDDYFYDYVNNRLSHSGHQILFFKNLHVQK